MPDYRGWKFWIVLGDNYPCETSLTYRSVPSGLDIQVSPDLAVLQVNPCVDEGDLFGGLSGSKFDSRVVTVEAVNEDSLNCQ